MSGEYVPSEVEITPEMIRAGVREFIKFDRDYDTEQDAVVRVFRAMLAAQKSNGEVA
jgi:hypothetical protein